MAQGTQEKRADVQLEAAFINFGTPHCRKAVMADDTAGDQEDKFWDMNAVDFDGIETAYEIVLDSGTGTHVVTAGKTLVTVTYTSGDDAATIAGLVAAAMDAITGIKAWAIGSEVYYENWYSAPVTTEVNTGAPGITFEVLQVGQGGNLGASDGPFDVTLGTETVELTANQFGATIIGESFAGNSIEVSGSFLEVNPALRESLLEAVGATVDLGGGKKFTGLGESKLFKNLDDSSSRMIIHPIRNDADNRDDDFIIWRAAFKPDTYNFDGENPRALAGTFSGYLDASKNKGINLCGFGDWTDPGLDA